MEEITIPTKEFDFTKLSLAHPNGLQGGAYFTKLSNNNEPLFMQTPKCTTKQGIVITGKKTYADLLFTNTDDVFLEWLENLETTLQKLIYEKRDLWFESDIELNDIEHSFTSPVRSYKGGKFYLVRTNVSQSKHFQGKKSCTVYNEDEKILTLNDVTDNNNLISIIEIQGVRFSSRTFQIELVLKQVMLLDDRPPLFQNCVIVRNSVNNELDDSSQPVETLKEEANASDTLIDNTLEVPNVEIDDSPSLALETNLENTLEERMTKYKKEVNQNVESVNETVNESVNETVNETVNESANDLDNLDNLDNLEELDNTSEKAELKEEVVDLVVGVESDSLEKKEENIKLETTETENLDDKKETAELTEVNLELDDDADADGITLKNPNEVYYEIYRSAREKAKLAKKAAIQAYLEAKNIKATYMLDDIDDSENEEENEDSFNNLE